MHNLDLPRTGLARERSTSIAQCSDFNFWLCGAILSRVVGVAASVHQSDRFNGGDAPGSRDPRDAGASHRHKGRLRAPIILADGCERAVPATYEDGSVRLITRSNRGDLLRGCNFPSDG
jgi:hypothetical protein